MIKKWLVPLGDAHLGAKTFREDLFCETIDWCKKNDASVILMGDEIENNNRESPGAGVYEQRIEPQEQLRKVIELLKPIQSNILGILDSNHLYRSYRICGIHPTKIIAQALDIPYLGYSAFLKIKVGEQEYRIYARHGDGTARTPEQAMRVCKSYAFTNLAHIYLHGHFHQKAWSHDIVELGDSEYQRTFVLTGSFLDYHGSYAEQAGLAPAELGTPKIWLNGKDFEVKVET